VGGNASAATFGPDFARKLAPIIAEIMGQGVTLNVRGGCNGTRRIVDRGPGRRYPRKDWLIDLGFPLGLPLEKSCTYKGQTAGLVERANSSPTDRWRGLKNQCPDVHMRAAIESLCRLG
jgi:hypothetical protein